MSNYYIIGSGIVGCVIARELADHGHTVTIYERRNHIGGNLYDYTDEYGIRVQQYGPHIFHTNDEDIYNYFTKYCHVENYNLVCGSVMDGQCVPTAFDFQSIDAFFPDEKEVIKDRIQQIFKGRTSATVLELLDCDDEYVQKFANFLYEKDYRPYTAKQWGISPAEIDKSIFKRVPILFSYGSKYFNDPYQVMPTNGYMELITNLVNHPSINVHLNTDGLDIFSLKNNNVFKNDAIIDGTLIYTGPIDELFHCDIGELPYRSLRFKWVHEDIDSFQDMPVVAYPQAADYTRITEYKKLPIQQVSGTTYAVEYPLPYKPGQKQEPYYPVPSEESNILYNKYRDRTKTIQNLICCGRLADYQYYNIDQAISRALGIASDLLNTD